MTFISNIIYQTCQLFLGSCWTFVFIVSTGQEIILFIQYVAVLDLHFCCCCFKLISEFSMILLCIFFYREE